MISRSMDGPGYRPIAHHEAALALEDGSVFVGESFGALANADAEVIFYTGITGYQEVTSDPSYRGQMVVMTHPQIGNYGISRGADESVRPWVAALIVRELAGYPHHWESTETLSAYLARWGVPGLQGVDTRALVRRLRETGTMRAVLRQSVSSAFTSGEMDRMRQEANAVPTLSERQLVNEVSAVLPELENSAGSPIVVLDLGAKWNILRSLERRGVQPFVVPWDTSAAAVLERRPRGIVISNGPGDPDRLDRVVPEVRALLATGTPVLGICLGHQLLALASGGTTSRLRYGHHGGNHPVLHLASGRVTITTQNHEFQVDRDSISPASGFQISYLNLNDQSVEGLRHRELPAFSVQYHPEGCPGPQDSQAIFDEFLALAGVPGSASLAAKTTPGSVPA